MGRSRENPDARRAHAHPMAPTSTLRSLLPPLPLEVRPLARVLPGGALEFHDAWIPSPGPCALVLWRPGREPAFALGRGAIARAGASWRYEGVGEGWVVLWVPESAQGPHPKGHKP